MKQSKICILVLLLALLPTTAGAGELPQVKPSEVGMSAKKLAGVDRVVNALVTRKRLAGAIVMLSSGHVPAYFSSPRQIIGLARWKLSSSVSRRPAGEVHRSSDDTRPSLVKAPPP